MAKMTGANEATVNEPAGVWLGDVREH